MQCSGLGGGATQQSEAEGGGVALDGSDEAFIALAAQAGEAARRREEIEQLAIVKERVVAVGAAEQEGADGRARREIKEVELRGRLQVVVQHPELADEGPVCAARARVSGSGRWQSWSWTY